MRTLIIVVVLALLAGAGVAYYFLRGGEIAREASPIFALRREQPSAPVTPEPTPTTSASGEVDVAQARQAVERVERVVEQQGGLDARVAAMEQRLTRLDLQSQAAAGNAARAEGLLIAFAARRALERGAPLGYLEDQLRLRFGDAQPNAVTTVIEAGRNPVTLDSLLARLDALSVSMTENPRSEGVIDWLGREMSELFVIRREGTPSPVAKRRLERARLFLQSGRANAALSEVRNLPNAQSAARWIHDAERYAKAQQAIELLETTAVLDRQNLRDGSGTRVSETAAN
ncbi:hypothetical protein D2V17_16165 [Aurantiacibacter xanthus]|uniref:Uncharacterized protein n=1 Tax=Aurantiacibacter xanthus TaxID=1784712 RepID=A0A3A1P1X8_9SPHN|nr:hypothetical protein D2V17_16165 [Aurantiacibacter xanthus]